MQRLAEDDELSVTVVDRSLKVMSVPISRGKSVGRRDRWKVELGYEIKVLISSNEFAERQKRADVKEGESRTRRRNTTA